MVSEAEMRERFARGYEFPPLAIRLTRDTKQADDEGIDAFFAVESNNQRYEFAAEFKSRNSPRIFEDALPRLERAAKRLNLLPMFVAPFLQESQLNELQQRGISGIDLCGNGVVAVPGELLVYRTGYPNQFRDSAPTKYAYRGATSLAARAFLCRSNYQSLYDIDQEINARGGHVALSTISKALKRLESDLIVDRTEAGIRLRQSDKLLEQLGNSFTAPKVTKTMTLSLSKRFADTQRILPKQLRSRAIQGLANLPRPKLADARVALSGRSSVEAYAVMGRQDGLVLYTSSIDRLIDVWGELVEPTSRFVDFELQQTDDPTVYFDVRTKENLPYASPIQVYLECLTGDKREQETAMQLKRLILSELK